MPKFRPYVPESLRDAIMHSFHDLAHTGIRPTVKSISNNYVWHSMRKDISKFVKECFGCQSSKVLKHNSHPVKQFYSEPTEKFTDIHCDLVGPLPESQGFAYILTVVDRITRWPVAIPIPDMTAKTVANALNYGWIANFGIPTVIVSDRGRQFVANLWSAILDVFGSDAKTTTAYHPQSNGMVERFHRTFKAGLMAKLSYTTEWVSELPAVLLGVRTAYREEFGMSIAELVLGQELAVPGCMLFKDPSVNPPQQPHPFFRKISELVEQRRSVPRHGIHGHYRDPNLDSAEYVFVRDDAVRKPLCRPYRGPFKVLHRNDDFFELMVRGKPDKVSTDRLKAAYGDFTS